MNHNATHVFRHDEIRESKSALRPLHFNPKKREVMTKVKVIFTLELVMKAQRGSKCIAILFL